jgi:hypothetical protein
MDILYNKIQFAPKWVVTPYEELRYVTGYEVSKRHVDVKYMLADAGMLYEIISPCQNYRQPHPYPKGCNCEEVYVMGS